MIAREVERLLLYGILAVGVVLTLAPFLWMLSASVMPAGEASSYPPRLVPSDFTLEHYEDLFTRLNLARYFFNSIFIAGWVTILQAITCAMAAYAFARLKWPGRDKVFLHRKYLDVLFGETHRGAAILPMLRR